MGVTPAVQMTVLLAMRSPATTTPSASTKSTDLPKRISTPSLVEPCLGSLGKVFGEGAEDSLAPIDHDDSRRCRVDPAELRTERSAYEVCKCAGQFYARGTSAHQNNRQQVAVASRVFFRLGHFKRTENFVANGNGGCRRVFFSPEQTS